MILSWSSEVTKLLLMHLAAQITPNIIIIIIILICHRTHITEFQEHKAVALPAD